MSFSEAIKAESKKKSHFTCCWCLNRDNKVDIHHIIPQSEGGPDTEGNAAPLCGSCHDKYGNNPDLRKEIRARRDQWYEVCARRFEIEWPIGLDVPLLSFHREIPAARGIPNKGIQLTDRDPNDRIYPPSLYISIHFKSSRFFSDDLPPSQEKWLYIQADMRFALDLRIQVRAWNERDEIELRSFLQKGNDSWMLQGLTPDLGDKSKEDTFYVWRENSENRLLIATYTPTLAVISIHARLSEQVATVFDNYLAEMGFSESDDYV